MPNQNCLHIISKSQAKEIGLKSYFTGKPCKHGHYAERMVSKSTCKECNRLSGLKYYQENKDRISESVRDYREENKEKSAEYRLSIKSRMKILNRRYYQNNSEELKAKSRVWHKENYSSVRDSRIEYMAKWAEENKELKRSIDRNYYAKNKDRIKDYTCCYYLENKQHISDRNRKYKSSNRARYNFLSAKRRSAKKMAIPSWYEKEAVKMVYLKAKEFGMQVDHIVPLTSDIVCGLHCWHNLQLLDSSINISKGNRHWPDMPE